MSTLQPPATGPLLAAGAGTELLALAAALLALAAAALTGFGLRRQRYRGWLAWPSALWLAAAGSVLAASTTTGAAHTLASLLLMQAPVLVLLGLRRFNARHALPGRAWHDAAALAGAVLLCAVAAAFGSPAAGWPATAATLALHGYVALVLLRGAEGRDTVPLQSLGVAWALASLAPLLPAFAAAEGLHAPVVLRALATALAGGITAFVVLMLVCERSERQLRDSRRRLRTLANMDALTQVPNRRHFHELATLALRHDPPGSAVLLMFDIDHFKAINDHLGHASGDRVLTIVSGAVLEHLRAHDVAGRQGGDEFVLLLRRADTPAAMGVAARIVAEVQHRAAETRLPHLSLSFGVVQLGDGERVEDAIRRADQAMYEAKRQGRSRAVAAEGNEAHPVFRESQRLGLTPA